MTEEVTDDLTPIRPSDLMVIEVTDPIQKAAQTIRSAIIDLVHAAEASDEPVRYYAEIEVLAQVAIRLTGRSSR